MELHDGHIIRNSFFVLVGSDSSRIIESFTRSLYRQTLVSSNPSYHREDESKNPIVFYWDSQNTLTHFSLEVASLSCLSPLKGCLRQVLINFYFQSGYFIKRIVLHSLPDEVLNFVKEFFFWLLTFFDNISIRVPVLLTYNFTLISKLISFTRYQNLWFKFFFFFSAILFF